MIVAHLPAQIQGVISVSWLLAWGLRQWVRYRKLQNHITQHLDELAQLKQIMDQSLMANVLFDKMGRVVWMNRTTSQVFKVSEEYIRTVNPFKDRHWQRIGWSQALQATLDDGRSRTIDYHGLGTLGQKLDVLVTFSRIGRLGQTYLLEQALDLTDMYQMQQFLEESQRWYQKLFYESPDGYFIVDKKNARILDCNAAGCQLLRASSEQILNTKAWDWVPDYQPDGTRSEDVLARSMLQLVKTGQIELDVLCQRRGGTLLWLNLFLSLASREEQPVVLINCRDITARKQLDQNLQETTGQLMTVLANTSVGIVHVMDRHLKWSNARMAEMFGFTPEAMKGISLRVLYPDDASYEAIGKNAYPILLEGRQYVQELPLLHQDGHKFWVRLTGRMIEVKRPELGVIWVLEDITEQKQSQEQLALFKTFIEIAHEPFHVIDMDDGGRMVMINQATETHFGVPRETILTWRIPDWDPEFSEADLPIFFAQIQNGSLKSIKTQHQIGNGLRVPVEVSLNHLVDHAGRHLLYGWFNDISQQEQTRRMLLEARLKAEQANRAKSEFLSNMSHEIRTPINGIMGLLQLLEQTPLNETQANYIKRAFASSHVLLRVINDILDLSRIESGHLELQSERFKLSSVIYSVVDMLMPLATKKNLAFDVTIQSGCPDWVLGDGVRLQQILINLGNNAIKFTDQGRVALEVCFAMTADDRVSLRFEISDTGIGISADQQKQVFQRFMQVDSGDDRRFGGSGLGLSIVSSLVHAMHGQVGVESVLGEGSVFWFILTMEQAEPEQSETLDNLDTDLTPIVLPDPESLDGLRILVVEDNEMNRYVVLDLLDGLGADAVAAENGQEGIDLLLAANGPEASSELPFDLVIMDVQMPVMDGLVATRLLREQYQMTDLPIIAVTAGVLGNDREKCLKAGMNDFLLKPVEIKQLYHVISQYCQDSEPLGLPVVSQQPVESSSETDFDLATALKNLGGERNIYTGLVKRFMQSLNDTHYELSQSKDNSPESSAKAAKLLHRLRGSALTVGAVGLAESCRRLEMAIHESDPPEPREREALWHELDQAFDTVQTHLPDQVKAAGIELDEE